MLFIFYNICFTLAMTAYRRAANIIITGMKSSGKTTLGRKIAASRGSNFIDLDNLIEKRFYKSEKTFLRFREIYKRVGEETFRELEAEAAAELSKTIKSGNFIVSLGGGTAANTKAVTQLKGGGLFVYLNVDASVLFTRISRKGIPPFLKKGDPRENFIKLYNDRVPLFREIADITIDLTDEPIDHQFNIVETRLAEAGYGW